MDIMGMTAYIFKRKNDRRYYRLYDKCAIVITDTEDAAYDVLVEADEVVVGGKIMEWNSPICASWVKVGPKSILSYWNAILWTANSLYTVVYNDCASRVALGESDGTVEDDGSVTVYTGLPLDQSIEVEYATSSVVMTHPLTGVR